MIRSFRPQGFQFKIFILSILLTLTMSSMLLYTFHIINKHSSIRILSDFSDDSFNQADKSLSTYFDKLSQNAYETLNDPDLITITNQKLNALRISEIRKALESLDSVMNRHLSIGYIKDAYYFGMNDFSYHLVYGSTGSYISDEFNFASFNEWFIQSVGSDLDTPIFTSPETSDPSLQSIIRNWKGQIVFFDVLRVSSDVKGILVLTIDPQLFSDFIRPPLNGETIFVQNDHNQTLYQTSASIAPSDVTDNEQSYLESGNSMVLKYSSKFTRLRFISSMDQNSQTLFLRQHLWNGWNVTAALFLFGILFTLSHLFIRKLMRPVLEVTRLLRQDLSSQFSTPKIALPRFSIRQKILMYLFLTTFVPNTILVGYLSYKDYFSYQDKLDDLQSHMIGIVLQSIDYSLRDIESTSRDMFSNEDVQNALTSLKSGKPLTQIYESSVISHFSIRSGIISAAILDLQGKPIYSTTYFDYQALKSLNYDTSALPLDNGNLHYIPESPDSPKASSNLNFVRRIAGLSGSYYNKAIGYLFIQIDRESFNRILDGLKIGSRGELYLFDDKSGELLVQSDNDPNHSSTAQSVYQLVHQTNVSPLAQNDRLYYSEKTELFDFRFASIVSLSEIRGQVLGYLKNYLYLFAVFTLLIFLISTSISRQLTKPIRLLMSAAKRIENGDLQVIVPSAGGDELAILTQHFNRMILRINELIEENYQSKIRENELMFLEKEAQFKALQQQINPHFLYNTLESIKWMAYRHGITEISNMASALGKFFRGSISSSSDLISISKEVEHLQSYIYIQKIRYQEKFEVDLQIEENIMPLPIIRLILQPLIENSILHGLDSIEEHGLIQIHGCLHENRICFSIKDNGIGMDEATLMTVREKIHSSGANDSIGLSNVYRRLQLYFKNDVEFTIESALGTGTEIRFSYPV